MTISAGPKRKNPDDRSATANNIQANKSSSDHLTRSPQKSPKWISRMIGMLVKVPRWFHPIVTEKRAVQTKLGDRKTHPLPLANKGACLAWSYLSTFSTQHPFPEGIKKSTKSLQTSTKKEPDTVLYFVDCKEARKEAMTFSEAMKVIFVSCCV